MKRMITKIIICMTLSSMCFATENIEQDIEIGLSAKSNSSPIIQEEQKVDEQPAVLLGDSDGSEVDIETRAARDTNLHENYLSNFVRLIRKNTGKLAIATLSSIIAYKVCQ